MIKFLRIASWLCLLFPSLLLAQDFRATLTGTVTDSSKSAVPEAAVQATNTATNEVASATTNAQGNYTIPFLKPGTYTVAKSARPRAFGRPSIPRTGSDGGKNR